MIKQEKLRKGQVINHSNISLLIIENDSGKPIVHLLGPKQKSPNGIDADGFKRADGESIFLHKDWWKIIDGSKADIWQIGENFLIPVSLMKPVPDNHFGTYSMDTEENWGEKLTYVKGVIKDKRGKTIGYLCEKFGKISKSEAIRLVNVGKLDNVVIVENSQGKVFLRTKKNSTPMDNLIA